MQPTRTIHCEVHGHIELPTRLFKLIDTPVVQRLRRLSQCGVVSYVYPAATHNRFEHSLGVAYLAGVVASHLQKNQPELGITDQEVFCIQAAGLLHDIGHGPFSHLFEQLVCNFHHEEQTVRLMELLKPEIDLTEYEWGIIRQCIEGPDDPYDRRTFLYEIVSNKESGLDVDKMDYIQRDSKRTTIHLGCDVMRIVMNCRVNFVAGIGRICFNEKVVEDITALFHARYKLHKTVYQHQVVTAVGMMLIDAMNFADLNGCFKDTLEKNCLDLNKFLLLDDAVFTTMISCSSDIANNLIDRIMRRRLYKCVIEAPFQYGSELVHMLTPVLSNIRGKPVSYHWGLQYVNPLKHVFFFGKKHITHARHLYYFGDDMPSKFRTDLMRIYTEEPEKITEDTKEYLKSIQSRYSPNPL